MSDKREGVARNERVPMQTRVAAAISPRKGAGDVRISAFWPCTCYGCTKELPVLRRANDYPGTLARSIITCSHSIQVWRGLDRGY